MSNRWEITDGCADQYRCTTALCLLSMLAHSYNIIIDHHFAAPRHGREVFDGFNDTYKDFLTVIMTKLQMPSVEAYNTQMVVHTSTMDTDNSCAR